MKTTEPRPRPYVMRERADRVARTRAAILDAVIALGTTQPLASVTLPAVARRAGVSVQTVLRQFGSRDATLDAAVERNQREVVAERTVDPRDLDNSLEALVDHYEARGDGVLLLLAQESWEPLAARITGDGKRLHREWVEAVFARPLATLPDDARPAVVDQLVVATDVYAWKLLRRDRGLDRDTTLGRMRSLALAVLAAHGTGTAPAPRQP